MKQSLDELVADLAGHPEGFASLFARKGYVPFLPLLELPYPEVNERLTTALIGAGVPEEVVRSVSLRELVGFALERATPYWADRSVRWLHAGFPLDRGLSDALNQLAQRCDEYPQRLRHQAFGLVRRWDREQRGID